MDRRTLTPRQRDIANLVRDARSNGEIAQTLRISVSTLKIELAMIYVKTNARNRIALAVHWEREHPRQRSRS